MIFYIIKCAIVVFYLFAYLSIYLFLFVCDHWDDWDKICHAQLGSVGDNFNMILFRITDFPLSL